MDKQQKIAVINHAVKILFWAGLLVLLAYSFLTIMDLEEFVDHRRQAAFLRCLTAISKADLSDSETSHQVKTEMWETFQMALLATTISAVFAFPFSYFCARPSSSWSRGFNILLQPILSVFRAVHPLLVIFPAVILAGIGPTAGVLALTFYSTAVLIGDFTEYAQGNMSQSWSMLFKVYFPGLAFKRLPFNILIASVLGFAGGGGIGQFLVINISILNYRDTSVAILACIIVIGSLDLISRAVWHKIQSHTTTLLSTPEITNLQNG